MMEIELSNGTKVCIATSEILAFTPTKDGTQITLRANPALMQGASQFHVKTGMDKLRDAYNLARRVE